MPIRPGGDREASRATESLAKFRKELDQATKSVQQRGKATGQAAKAAASGGGGGGFSLGGAAAIAGIAGGVIAGMSRLAQAMEASGEKFGIVGDAIVGMVANLGREFDKLSGTIAVNQGAQNRVGSLFRPFAEAGIGVSDAALRQQAEISIAQEKRIQDLNLRTRAAVDAAQFGGDTDKAKQVRAYGFGGQ